MFTIKMFTIKKCLQFQGKEDVHCNAQGKGCKRPPGRFQDNLMRWFWLGMNAQEQGGGCLRFFFVSRLSPPPPAAVMDYGGQ